MDVRLTLFVLFISTIAVNGKIMKCAQAPSNKCGPNAKCHDKDYYLLFKSQDISYCKCYSTATGEPPNCKIICEGDVHCKSHEYCGYDPTLKSICIEGCREYTCGKKQYCDMGTRQCAKGCTYNDDCNDDEICNVRSHQCQKVCDEKSCGENGKCESKNRTKHCSCIDGYTQVGINGCENVTNPLTTCEAGCGPNSVCRNISDAPVCFCQEGYHGVPPNCHPECLNHYECPYLLRCLNNKCVDPCNDNTCGENARCFVRSHNPICTCINGYTGDPFQRCDRFIIYDDESVFDRNR